MLLTSPETDRRTNVMTSQPGRPGGEPDTDGRPAGHSGHAGHSGRTGHSHGPAASADRRYLLGAPLLAAFMAGEVITAVLPGSLALLSDAGTH
jgi:cobalt-zinc-cadmium efflux system protein